jgi:hypothetical protein
MACAAARDRGESILSLLSRRLQPVKFVMGPTGVLRRMTASLGLGALLALCHAGPASAPVCAMPESALGGLPPDAEVEPLRDEPVGLPPVADPPDTGAVAPHAGPVARPVDSSIVLPPVPATTVAAIDTVPEAAPVGGAAASPLNESARLDSGEPVPQSTMAIPAASAVRQPPAPEEAINFGGMRVPRWIVETVVRAAGQTGVDPVYMMALADKESSFLPSNKARTSSAEGLFQFVDATWLEVVKLFGARHGFAAEAAAIEGALGSLTVPDAQMRERILELRRDPYVSALMAGEMLKRDRSRIERRLGRSISRSEFYLAHFFGTESACKFMSLLSGKPKQSAPKSFPSAAKANRALFYDQDGRKARQLSVAEVFDRIDAMIDRRLGRYEHVARFTSVEVGL